MSGVSRAIVLCAGLGTRMRPLTLERPKPLVMLAGKPLLDYALDWLAAAGVAEVVVNTHYKAEMIEAHLATRRTPHIFLSHEDTLLETGGGIAKALPLLGDAPFFSLNSDALCVDAPGESALTRLREGWNDGLDGLLLLAPRERALGYDGAGDFFLEGEGRLVRRAGASAAPYVFTGVQLLHPRFFEAAPAGPFSLNRLYDRGAENGRLSARLRGLVHAGDWLHVGDVQALASAERYLEDFARR